MSKGKLIAFRVVAVIGAILGATGVIYMIAGFTSDDQLIHRFHNVANGLPFLAFATAVLIAAAMRPEAAVAPFRTWIGFNLAIVVGGILGGDLVKGGFVVMTALAIVTYVLHPSRSEINRCMSANAAQLLLGAAALVPAFIYALHQGDLQKAFPDSPHGEFHHFSGMGMSALALGAAGIAASFPGTGKRMATWLAGGTAVLLGIASLLLSDYDGHWDSPWSWIAIAYGVVFVLAGELGRPKFAQSS